MHEIYSLLIRLINLALINKIFCTYGPKRNFIFNVKFPILFVVSFKFLASTRVVCNIVYVQVRG
jgi:hypothetical protein